MHEFFPKNNKNSATFIRYRRVPHMMPIGSKRVLIYSLFTVVPFFPHRHRASIKYQPLLREIWTVVNRMSSSSNVLSNAIDPFIGHYLSSSELNNSLSMYCSVLFKMRIFHSNESFLLAFFLPTKKRCNREGMGAK